MSVTVDDQPLGAEALGLKTVGQLLAYLRSNQRLVVHMMVDGHEPDLDQIETLRALSLDERTLFIETIEPKQIATDVFDQVQNLLCDAELLRGQAVSHLQAGEMADALKKLGSCFTTWNHTQESIEKIARLLSVDLENINLGQGSLQTWLQSFSRQLSDIRSALEARDYVTLSDILAYEAHQTSSRWQEAIEAIRATIE